MRGALKRRDIDAADLARLLVRFNADRSQAWHEYNKLLSRLTMFFEPCFEASELADEVLDRMAQKLETQEITDLTQFAFGVARNVRKEFWQASASNLQMQDEIAGTDQDSENSIVHALDGQRKHECFLRCMQQFSAEDQRLLLEYHPGHHGKVEESRQRLASAVGLSPGALRNKVARLRAKLEQCCRQFYTKSSRLLRQ